jgi:hypothetical protein
MAPPLNPAASASDTGARGATHATILHDLLGHSGHPNPPFGEGCPLTWATWTRDTD